MRTRDGAVARAMAVMAGLFAALMGLDAILRTYWEWRFLQMKIDFLRQDPSSTFEVPARYMDLHEVDRYAPFAFLMLAIAVYRLGKRLDLLMTPSETAIREG